MSEFQSVAPNQLEQFFKLLAESGNVSASAATAQISRAYVYKLLKQDPTFLARWDEAFGKLRDRTQDAVVDEALTGRPIFDANGIVVGRKRNTRLLERLAVTHGVLDHERPTVAIQNNVNNTKLPPATTEADYHAAMRQLVIDVQALEVDPDEDIL